MGTRKKSRRKKGVDRNEVPMTVEAQRGKREKTEKRRKKATATSPTSRPSPPGREGGAEKKKKDLLVY